MNAITRIEQPALLWPDECGAFTRDSVDSLYAWAYQLGASGIRLQTDRPIIVQLHGRIQRVTRRSLSGLEVEEAVNRLYGADGQARLKSGEDFECPMKSSRTGAPGCASASTRRPFCRVAMTALR